VSIASAVKVFFFQLCSGRDCNKFSRPLRAVPNRSRVDLGKRISKCVVDCVSWRPPCAFRRVGANFNNSTQEKPTDKVNEVWLLKGCAPCGPCHTPMAVWCRIMATAPMPSGICDRTVDGTVRFRKIPYYSALCPFGLLWPFGRNQIFRPTD
jgi:hypothetical protein